jgi:hypothetical protein
MKNNILKLILKTFGSEEDINKNIKIIEVLNISPFIKIKFETIDTGLNYVKIFAPIKCDQTTKWYAINNTYSLSYDTVFHIPVLHIELTTSNCANSENFDNIIWETEELHNNLCYATKRQNHVWFGYKKN